jgi:hypothetical protein
LSRTRKGYSSLGHRGNSSRTNSVQASRMPKVWLLFTRIRLSFSAINFAWLN